MSSSQLDGSPGTPASRTEIRVVAAATAVFFGYLIFLLTAPFRRSAAFWMAYTQDDFFYYLKVAQNIVAGHGSTFNGIAKTNGYHPLYEGVLILLSHVTRSPHGLLVFLAMLTFCAAASTYALSTHLIRRTGVSLLLAATLSMWITDYALRTFYYGMEVSFAIPLLLACAAVILRPRFWQAGFGSALLLGLLLATTILSRLDCAIFVGLVTAGVLATPQLRRQLRGPVVLGLCVGMLPVVVYVLFNHFDFGTWMPISGMAKQLKPTLHPTRKTWDSLYYFVPAFLAVMLPIPFAILLFPKIFRQIAPIERVVYLSCLFFPWIYYFILCCVSDWVIWGWYMYPLRVAVCLSFVVFCTWKPLARLLQLPWVTAALMLAFLGYLALSSWRIQLPELYAASVDIQKFEATHPGIYAMGDRAGSVSYLIQSPVVQTEGLMMDKAFLQNVKRERDLRQVLAEYHVRYYIGTTLPGTPPSPDGCFHAQEPSQGGANSPKMRSVFCEKPIRQIEHDATINYIFDLTPDR